MLVNILIDSTRVELCYSKTSSLDAGSKVHILMDKFSATSSGKNVTLVMEY